MPEGRALFYITFLWKALGEYAILKTAVYDSISAVSHEGGDSCAMP